MKLLRWFPAALILFLLPCAALSAQTVISLHEAEDGRLMMDAAVNGVGVKTYYTPDNWYASMSSTTYLFLYENGYIAPAEVNGMTTVKMPGGGTVKAASFVIRELKIGRLLVRNLPAFVITKQNVPLIVGNSAFDCFGTVSVEGLELTIDDRFPEDFEAAEPAAPEAAEVAAAPAEDSAAALGKDVGQALAAKDYARAAEDFARLQELGVMTLYSEYQYAMVLNILHRNDDCIALTRRWLDDNEGKAPTLDYWMYDALGDCHARKGDKPAAIRYYEEAVAAYCRMFNVSEKDIRRSQFKDETLGYTLYDLAMQYAATDMGQCRHYCTLAAKSGNAAAIDFCRKAGYNF